MRNSSSSDKNSIMKNDFALLLIDVISDFEFEDGEKLIKYALPMSRKLAWLKARAKKAGIPVIYINNNFGKWQEDFAETVKYCLENSVRGNKIVELLKPENDFYVLKPMHSAFYSTTLDLLLSNLGSKNLILTGVTADICILFTANDAYMREYQLIIPQDCVAAVKPKDKKSALEYFKRVLKAEVLSSEEIDFG